MCVKLVSISIQKNQKLFQGKKKYIYNNIYIIMNLYLYNN